MDEEKSVLDEDESHHSIGQAGQYRTTAFLHGNNPYAVCLSIIFKKSKATNIMVVLLLFEQFSNVPPMRGLAKSLTF